MIVELIIVTTLIIIMIMIIIQLMLLLLLLLIKLIGALVDGRQRGARGGGVEAEGRKQ